MIRVATLTRQHRAGLDRALAGRVDHRTAAGRRAGTRGAHAHGDRRLLERQAPSAARGSRRPLHRARPVHAGGGDVSGRLLPRQRQPRADASRVRSGPSVSLHLEPQQELRRRGRGSGRDEVRAREGAGRPAPLHPDSTVDGAAPGRDLRVARGRRPAESRRALPRRAGSQRASVSHHPRHGHRAAGGRGRRSAGVGGPEPEGAAARPHYAARGRSRHAAAGAEHPRRELRAGRVGGGVDEGAPGHGRLARAHADSAAGPQGHAICGPDHLARQPARPGVRWHQGPGRAGPPSLRFVFDGRDIPRRRHRRSAGGGHQDHALPDRQQFAPSSTA